MRSRRRCSTSQWMPTSRRSKPSLKHSRRRRQSTRSKHTQSARRSRMTCLVEISHEPHSTTCACGCVLQRVGEDVTQKLDYTPGVFTVQNHVRGKWACRGCRTMTQAALPPEIIDKGIPYSRPAGARAGGQALGSSAALQAGSDLRPCWSGHPALNPGCKGGRLRRAPAAAGGCT